MAVAPEAEAMNRTGDGGANKKNNNGKKTTKKEERAARLQKQVQEEKERNHKNDPPKKEEDTTPNPIVDAVGNAICCFGILDSGQMGICRFCAPCLRCCCGVSAANS